MIIMVGARKIRCLLCLPYQGMAREAFQLVAYTEKHFEEILRSVLLNCMLVTRPRPAKAARMLRSQSADLENRTASKGLASITSAFSIPEEGRSLGADDDSEVFEKQRVADSPRKQSLPLEDKSMDSEVGDKLRNCLLLLTKTVESGR